MISMSTLIIIVFLSFLAGLVSPTWWWRRRLRMLDLVWRMNVANYINSGIASLLGGEVRDGVIYLPDNEEENEEQPEEKLKN